MESFLEILRIIFVSLLVIIALAYSYVIVQYAYMVRNIKKEFKKTQKEMDEFFTEIIK